MRKLKVLEEKVLTDLGLSTVLETIDKVLEWTPPDVPDQPPPEAPGLYHYNGSHWSQVNFDSVPYFAVFDFETAKNEEGQWLPRVCGILTLEGWFYWVCSPGDRYMPLIGEHLLVGHNSVSYDRKYLANEYEPGNPNLHLDTMAMANIMRSLGGSTDKELYTVWQSFERQADNGGGVPEWFKMCGPLNLKHLCEVYLGVQHSKTVRDEWILDPTQVQPQTLAEYCMADVQLTARLFQVLFKKVFKHFAPSPITLYGMIKASGAKYHLRDWDKFIEDTDREASLASQYLMDIQNSLVSSATEDTYPELDWSAATRGKNKGVPRWKVSLTDRPFGCSTAVQLLKLRYGGSPVTHQKSGRGAPSWYANGEPLPHPISKDQNLGTPLCKDYHTHVISGVLTSDVVQDELENIFTTIMSLSQWGSYRSRYNGIYRKEVTPHMSISVDGLNPCGTISRRATSNLWVVLPKPKKGKVGSNVMHHIVAPPGHKMVSADFVSQEARLACLQITDSRAGKFCSSPWTKAVLTGDKSKGTDCHTMSAKILSIDRYNAKRANFLIQYGGALQGLTNLLRPLVSDPSTVAIDFIKKFKGKDGVASSTFRALEYLAELKDQRTYLLRVLQPNSLNPRYTPNPRNFWTVRGNWPIQSSAVDEKQTLIALIDVRAKQLGIEAQYLCDIHDRVVYSCPYDQAETLASIFNEAMKVLTTISLEEARDFWDKIDPVPSSRDIPQVTDNWFKFESVDVTDNLGEAE